MPILGLALQLELGGGLLTVHAVTLSGSGQGVTELFGGERYTRTLIRDVPWQSISLEISKCTVTIA